MNNASELAYIEYNGEVDSGWRVPTKTDWDNLVIYLGGLLVAGGELKEMGTTYWDSPNTGATNSVGFSARGAGYDNSFVGVDNHIKESTYFWASTASGANAYSLPCLYNTALAGSGLYAKSGALSVRLVKDI